MVDFDGRALRAQLQADYKALSEGVRDAHALNEIYDTLTGTVLRTMRDLLNDWNRGRAIERLPPEVLASVFVQLPFRDRVLAAHVSRSWRDSALNFPAVWAHIDLSGFFLDKHRLLDMALSRTGQHPVDLEFSTVLPIDDIVTGALQIHMHHIRSFTWRSMRIFPPCASYPAPVLEYWECDCFVIPADFLGGQPGRLRRLHLSYAHFPESCPALSRLTELVIAEGPPSPEVAASFANIFALCPCLTSFTYSKAPAHYSHLLPVGPPVSSLTHLALGTRDDGYDLMPHYLAWRTDALQHVALHMAYFAETNIEPLLKGAEELTISKDSGLHGYTQTCITAHYGGRGPHGRTHSAGFADEDLPRVATLLLSAQEALTRVHSLFMSLVELDAFLELLAVLPALKNLTIYIESDTVPPDGPTVLQTLPPHHFRGDLITNLVRLQEDCPALERLTLEVVCLVTECPPNKDDALWLLEQLMELQDWRLPEIHIQGFNFKAGAMDVALEARGGRPLVVFDSIDVEGSYFARPKWPVVF